MLLAEVNGASFVLVDTFTFLVLMLFVIDLCLRVYAYRRMVLRQPAFYVDSIIVGLSLIFYLVGVVAEASAHSTSSYGVSASLRSLLIVLRWLRAARALVMLAKTTRAGTSAARQTTGGNKRRFVDLENRFDLDLAYVRPRLIAMSVPATGFTALYRNPLNEVVRFLESRHAREGYLIVNCCPELPYAHDRFPSGSVMAFDVQDHTPPTMAQFVEFLNAAAAATQRGRLLAIHCRGGKGRTGCMCCAWLLYSRDADDADDALALFALERTELGLGQKRLQGVDTPSQRRYVHQQRRDARWVIAGKEAGCLFYFLFHTGFVGAQQEIHVPLHMMDRACKNRSGKYQPEGEATLRFSAAAAAAQSADDAHASRSPTTPQAV